MVPLPDWYPYDPKRGNAMRFDAGVSQDKRWSTTVPKSATSGNRKRCADAEFMRTERAEACLDIGLQMQPTSIKRTVAKSSRLCLRAPRQHTAFASVSAHTC